MESSSLTSATTVRLVATLSIAYMLSQFLRASVAVIAPELRDTLSLSPDELALISGIFFTVFALAQIPLGIALDRVGPRQVLIVLSLFTVAGCLLFATAHTPAQLILGRAVMGLGCSGMLMGPYVIYARRFPASRFAEVASIQLGVGTMGGLLATAPMAAMSEIVGWRVVFYVTALLALGFAVATAAVTRDEKLPARPSHRAIDDLCGVIEVLRLPGIVAMMPLMFISYASVAALLTLWAGPYLTDVYGLEPEPRGSIMLAFALANIIGYFACGAIDRWVNSRRLLVTVAVMANGILLLALGLLPPLPLGVLTAALALIGFFGGSNVALFSHQRALLPEHLLGRGVTIANTANMLGVAAVQSLLAIIGRQLAGESGLNATAYGAMFIALGGLLLAAAAVYQRAPDYRPRGTAGG